MSAQGVASYSDILAAEEIPLEARCLPGTVLDAIRKGKTSSEGRDALVFMPDASTPDHVFRFSYDELIEAVSRVAGGLLKMSDSPRPVVSILLPNLPETHFSLWGAQTAGAANPVNPLLESSQMSDIIRAAGSEFLVTLDPRTSPGLYKKAVEAALAAGGVHTIVTVDPSVYAGGSAPDPQSASYEELPHDRGIQIISLPDLMRQGDGQVLPERHPDDTAALFHTGGTTGTPKIAQLSHANQVFSAWAGANNRFLQANKTIFCGLPLFHVNGVIVTGLLSWLNGATVVLGPSEGFRAKGLIENFWKIVETHKVGSVSAVPTIYQALLEQPVEDHDISSLEFVICGAAPISGAMINWFEQKIGVAMVEGYGCTEGACVSTITPGFGKRPSGSVGLRLPYQQLAIVDDNPESGQARRVPCGETGIIAIRGPNVFKGYLSEKDNDACWFRLDGDDWYNTGDMGRQDTQGFLFLTGRKKELIIRGGHNIDPAIIENAIETHPAVDLVAAIGSPDARVGEVPVAFVTLRKGAVTPEEELLEFARSSVPERAAVPKRIFILESLPLTAVGKIFKPELRRMEAERVMHEILGSLPGGEGLRSDVVLTAHRGAVVRVHTGAGAVPPELQKTIERRVAEFVLNVEFVDD